MFILLDIDGVMVPARSWKAPSMLKDGFYEFSSKATTGLKRIISETGASIVLTTSHKTRFSDHEWKDLFRNRNIEASVSTLKSDRILVSRSEEVLHWISSNSEANYVIIDDDKSLNGLPIDIKSKLVLTMPLVGLNESLVENAIGILRERKSLSNSFAMA